MWSDDERTVAELLAEHKAEQLRTTYKVLALAGVAVMWLAVWASGVAPLILGATLTGLGTSLALSKLGK